MAFNKHTRIFAASLLIDALLAMQTVVQAADTVLQNLNKLTPPIQYYGINSSNTSGRAYTPQVYHVKDYGALCNNSNDDTSAIQAAINAALAVQQPSGNTNGAVVFFPPGECKITAPLTAANPGYEASIALRGSGQQATTIISAVTGLVGYLINKPDDGGVTIKLIEDMAFINYSTSPFSGGIRLDRASNVTLNRLQVQASNALHIGGSDSNFQAISSITNASPGVVNSTAHKQRVGQAIAFDNDKTIFTVTAANATAGATYTDINTRTFTVDSTITGATTLFTTGQVAPASGTLTKTSGTGDATITFSASRSGLPLPLVDRYHTSSNYYIVSNGITANAFEVSATDGGAPINTTTAQYGTTTFLIHNNVFCVQVFGSVISSNQASGTAGSYGALVGQVEFYGTSFVGWDVAVAHSNVGLVIQGSRLETNNTGILLGDNIGYTDSATSHSALLTVNSFERNNVALNVLNASGVVAEGNSFTGNTSVDGLSTPVTGISLTTITSAKFSANTVGGTYSNAGIDLSGADAVSVVFDAQNVNITGTAWKMAANNQRVNFTFNGNDNIANSITFVGLPGQGGQHLTAVQGQTFFITDGNQATIGGNVTAGGGSNASLVTYDGTNWKRGY